MPDGINNGGGGEQQAQPGRYSWFMLFFIHYLSYRLRRWIVWSDFAVHSLELIWSPSHAEPQLKDLVLIQTVEWYNIGLQLGVENAELKVIQQNNPRDSEACKREMFSTWLRKASSHSYQQVVEALQAVGENREANRLCKRYGKRWEVGSFCAFQYHIFWSFLAGIEVQPQKTHPRAEKGYCTLVWP